MDGQTNFDRFIEDNQKQVLLVGAYAIQNTVLEILEERLSKAPEAASNAAELLGAIDGLSKMNDIMHKVMENNNARIMLEVKLADKYLKEYQGE